LNTADHYLTPRSIVLPEKLTDLHLVKKFPAFYGNRKFITSFTAPANYTYIYLKPEQSSPGIPIPLIEEPF